MPDPAPCYPRVLEYFGEKRARDITPDIVDAFLDGLSAEKKLSASSVNHRRTIVNGIFNFAVKRGRFDRNPLCSGKATAGTTWPRSDRLAGGVPYALGPGRR